MARSIHVHRVQDLLPKGRAFRVVSWHDSADPFGVDHCIPLKCENQSMQFVPLDAAGWRPQIICGRPQSSWVVAYPRCDSSLWPFTASRGPLLRSTLRRPHVGAMATGNTPP